MTTRALLLAACIGCGARPAPGAGPPEAPPPGPRGGGPTGPITLDDRDAAPPILDPVGASTVFAPAEPGAASYGSAAEPAAPGRLEGAVLAVARQRAGVVALDARLSRAAAQLAAIAPEEGALTDGVIEYARQRNGIPEPYPTLVVVRGDPGDPAAVAARLRDRLSAEMFLGRAIRIGIGAGPAAGARAIAVLIARADAVLEPVPRQLPAGATFAIAAVLDERMRDPELEIARGGRHALFRLPLARGPKGRVSAQVACGDPGRLDVELAATNPRGRVALARFPVWCGTPAPSSYVIAPPGVDAGIAEPAPASEANTPAERRLIALVNRDRVAAGAAPLRVDPRLAEAARRRAQVLRDTRGTAAPLDDGAIEAGVSASGAAGRGVGAVYEALANSSRDRERMLSPAWTHLGLGAAPSSEDLYVSLMYVAIPPRIDVEQGRRAIAAHLTRDGVIRVDADLADIAQRFAAQVAAGRTEASVWEEIKPRVDGVGRRYTRIDYGLSRSHELAVDRSERLIDVDRVDDLGVGVAQSDHATFGRRTIWVVVFWGQRLKLQGR
jgi:hypothetical protein